MIILCEMTGLIDISKDDILIFATQKHSYLHFRMAGKKEETYEGIDFDGIKESCGLENDEIKVLKICFNMFYFKDQGFLSGECKAYLLCVRLIKYSLVYI